MGRAANTTHLMKVTAFVLVSLALFLAGCGTRSISNSGYRANHRWGPADNPLYHGELSEWDVLGVAPKQDATEENIAKALAASAPPRLQRGERVLFIQSGALVPDGEMLDEAGKYFAVAPFSGVPPGEKQGFADSLRLRAAQGGCRFLVCYWGVLESAREELEGKAVSWVPIVGAFLPDEKQIMRIRLKALVVDVASGHWRMLTPPAESETGYDSRFTREADDQKRVRVLKERGYRALVTGLVSD